MALGVGDIPLNARPGFMQGLMDVNQFRQGALQNRIKQIEAQYAPLTYPAQAISQLAYANLMGPQFLAKLMGNTDILSNVPEQQKLPIVKRLLEAGGMSNFTNPLGAISSQAQSSSNPLAQVGNFISNLFSRNNPPQENKIPNLSLQRFYEANPSVKKAMDEEYVRTGQPQYTVPTNRVPLEVPEQPPKTFAENRAEYGKVVEQGKETGKLIAGDIKELNDVAFNANTMQGTLNELSSIVNSPEFNQIRQIPIAGQHEIGWYARFGTPGQKRMIGKFIDLQGQIVVDMASKFKGAFRVGEQSLINNMKVNPGDMPEVAMGKIISMSLMNQMLIQRTQRTAQLMEDYHMSKGNAMQIADKEINSDDIRKQIENEVKISIRNTKTGERRIVSLLEAKKMGIPNV